MEKEIFKSTEISGEAEKEKLEKFKLKQLEGLYISLNEFSPRPDIYFTHGQRREIEALTKKKRENQPLTAGEKAKYAESYPKYLLYQTNKLRKNWFVISLGYILGITGKNFIPDIPLNQQIRKKAEELKKQLDEKLSKNEMLTEEMVSQTDELIQKTSEALLATLSEEKKKELSEWKEKRLSSPTAAA